MASFAGKYYINGQDCYTTWGIVFLKGTYNELMKFPKRKDGYTISYSDENGTLRDADNAVYESQTYALPIGVIGSDEADFFSKLNAFRSYILSAGYFTFDVVDLNIRFTLLYADMSTTEIKTRLNNVQNAIKMTLSLINDFPSVYPVIP